MKGHDFLKGLIFALAAVAVATNAGMAGPLEPPPGPVTSTGRFGPRNDVATLPGDATATRVISQPGSYYLSENLTGQAGKSGIRIDANGVTLDLGGFSLVGVAGSLDGITANFRNQLSIHNGSIISWGGSGIKTGNGNDFIAREVIASGNGGWGMLFFQAGNPQQNMSIVQCIVRGNVAGGITADAYMSISQTQVNLNQGDGIRVSSTASILDSVVTDNTGTGIACNFDCLVRGNLAVGNAVNINAAGSTVIENEQ